MQVSILIPVYNKAFAIDRVLSAITKQIQEGDEIVVLDDGSNDESRQIIEKHDVKLITRERRNNSFRIASGRNLLVREAKNEHLIFLSGDCIPRAEFLGTHKRALSEVEPKTVIRGMVKPGQPFEKGYTNKWDRLITGNLSLRKWDFNYIGYLDENFDGCWGHEDMDFAYRAIKVHKYKIYCVNAWVDHIDHLRRDQIGKRNSLYFGYKHGLQSRFIPPKFNTSVSILIPVYNKEFAIGQVLESLLPQLDDNDEAIVLDDGSTDNSRKIMSSFGMKIISRDRKKDEFRIASGRNMLVREAENQRMIFLSGDCVPDPDYIKVYKETFDKIEPLTIIRGIIRHKGLKIPFDEGYHNDWERMHGTGNIGLYNWDFNLIGCLDENFDGNWGHEDRELAYRAVKIYKYRVYCAPATVEHIDHPSDIRGNKNLTYFKGKYGLK